MSARTISLPGTRLSWVEEHRATSQAPRKTHWLFWLVAIALALIVMLGHSHAGYRPRTVTAVPFSYGGVVVYRNSANVTVDRELIALHEAAHVVCARHFKVDAFGIVLDRAQPDNTAGYGRLYGINRLTAKQRRVIGVAGIVAELLHTGHSRQDGFNASDRALAGPMSGDELRLAVQTAKAILLAREDEWRAVAQDMLRR